MGLLIRAVLEFAEREMNVSTQIDLSNEETQTDMIYESSSTGPLAAGMGTLTGAAKTGSARAKRETMVAKDFMATSWN